jgi:polyhydroxybutyrate depolymerase
MGNYYSRLVRLGVTALICPFLIVACHAKGQGGSSVQSASLAPNLPKSKDSVTIPQRLYDSEIESNGRKRTYHFYLPPSNLTKGPLPVIFAFHGWGGKGKDMMEMSQLNRLANKQGVIIVYPDGVDGTWADGRGYTPADKAGVDDIAFTKALLNKLSERQNIDRSRVYAVGFSNGGHFAQRVGCELADSFSGIAVVASDFPTKLANRCNPVRPLSVIVIHGSEDKMSPAAGETEPGQEALSIDGTVQKWGSLNGCAATADTANLPTPVNDGLSISRTLYSKCRGNSQVVFYNIQGGGHTWPGGDLPEKIFGKTARNLDATSTIHQFFLD